MTSLSAEKPRDREVETQIILGANQAFAKQIAGAGGWFAPRYLYKWVVLGNSIFAMSSRVEKPVDHPISRIRNLCFHDTMLARVALPLFNR